MGAICGIITLDNEAKAIELGPRIFQKLNVFNYDYAANIEDAGVYFGCGLIYNTPESHHEQLPRTVNHRYLITADAIIDNRRELFDLLGIDHDELSKATDSELIIWAYEKWGYDCPKYLIGDYTFAIWDIDKKELYCARDVMGARTLYYTMESNMFAFSTIEKPLLAITEKHAKLNEKWVAGFLAIDGLQHNIDNRETIYSGIYQLLPAHYVVINNNGIKEVQYWDLLKDVKPVRFQSDEEYVEAFNSLFHEAVACRIRSAGEIAIMLSGGMDSGSIACVAARQLEDTNRKLYAFSSVPVQGFNEQPGVHYIYNESNEINLVADAYPNIAVAYSSYEGRSSLTDIDKYIAILEQPYKTYQNMTWYEPMLRDASKKNCTIMLNGQMGNSTISYGHFDTHLLTLFRAGQFITAAREVYAISKKMNIPLKRAYKLTGKIVMPYKMRSWRDRRRNKNYDRYHNVIVNRALVEKYELDKVLDDLGANILTSRLYDYDEDKAERVGHIGLTQIAAIETKLSLANHITIRDPSKDRRVVEFCLSIPSDQYVKNGNDRYLLRRAMKGILPEAIRTNINTKGRQSADWLYRLKPVWQEAIDQMDIILADRSIGHYVELEKLRAVRKAMDKCLEENDTKTVRLAIVAIIFYKFIVDFNQTYSSEVVK